MKKILFMVTSMDIGGVEKSLLSLLSEIPKGKYDITLQLLNKKGSFLKYIPEWIKIEEATWYKDVQPIIMQAPQKTIKDYYSNKQYTKIVPFIAVYFFSKRFDQRHVYYKQILKNVAKDKENYDVAIAYQGPTDIIDFYIANKVQANKKIAWIHFDVSQHSINQKLHIKLHKKFNKVFVVSEEARKRLIEKIPSDEPKIEVFKNIISSESIKEMAQEKEEFEPEFKGTKIVTVGRLSKEKGQDIAIKVLAKLIKNGYNVRWYCIGDGVDRKEYEKLIEEYGLTSEFILLGSKENPYPYIKMADIYVQPSRHEGYCLTLAEARCLQKPIITTDFSGSSEQITDNYDGFIVHVNEDKIYEKIKFLLHNPDKSNEFKLNLGKKNINRGKEVSKLYKFIQ